MTGTDSSARPESSVAVLGRLVPSVYFPWAAMSIGIGVLVVALPLYLLDLDASFTATSIVLGASAVGSLVAVLPAGGMLARVSVRSALLGSLAWITAGLALTALSDEPVVLGALQLAIGAATTSMRLAALMHITGAVPPLMRGRANSTIGGLRRLGAFVGPLLGGFLVDVVGFAATFLISAALSAVGLIPLAIAGRRAGSVLTEPPTRGPGLFVSLRRHASALVRIASGPALIMAARRGRTVLLPLVAASLDDVTAATVGLIVAIGTGADLLLFPVAGWLMDRFGRLRAIAPAFSLMALGLVALAFVDTAAGVILAGMLIGVGNGLSAGTMMTLAGDVAPADAPSQFISGFFAIQDVGQIAGAASVGIIADAAGLGAASLTLAAALVIGIGLIVLTIGETATATSG